MGALQTLPAATVITSDDLFYIVDDPSGTPVDKKATLSVLQNSLNLAKSNLFNAAMAEFPGTLYAIPGTRNNHPFVAFDDTTQWAVYFRGRVPWSANLAQGVTVYAQWAAASDTNVAHTIGWDVAFERLASNGQDLDSDNFGTAQTIAAAIIPASSGVTKQTSVGFTQAQLPASLALGDMFRVRIRRDVANDDSTGNAQLFQVELRWA